jgi:hypothetical protein
MIAVPTSAVARARQPVARPAALAQCGTYKNSWFDGLQGNYGQGATEGVYATLSTRVGVACGSDHSPTHNAVSSWAMVHSDHGSGGWVQSGLQAGWGECLEHFAQVLRTTSDVPQTKYGGCISADGSVHGYAEQYGSGCGCEYAKIDGTVWIGTSWNPFAYWNYPFVPEFSGEANYRESDMPGRASAREAFASLQGQNGNNNNFYSFACNGFLNGSPDSSRWSLAYSSCPEFDIWTN